MDLRLTPGKLRGSVTVPLCKTMQHYQLVAAALAGEKPDVADGTGDDVRATCRGAERLFAENNPMIECGGCGTALRLLLPIAMAMGGADFVCSEELCTRPLPTYADCTVENGHVRPKNALRSGIFPVPGNQSALFITGLLFALPLLNGDSTITFTTPLTEASEVNMALQILRAHGIQIEPSHNGYIVPGGQKYQPCTLPTERDWAAASYFSVMNHFGSDVELLGMTEPSVQNDARIGELCRELPETVDVYDIPDLVPALALLAALLPNRMTVLHHAGRMRLKESDRLHTIGATLRDLGATIVYTGESLFVFGREELTGGDVSARGDQRIAMLAAAAATCCKESVTIRGVECVSRIYPRFFEDLKALGMEITEV